MTRRHITATARPSYNAAIINNITTGIITISIQQRQTDRASVDAVDFWWRK